MAVDGILTIDQGTTNSKAILLDRNGQILALGSAPLNISYPKPGWVEQSPQGIWSSVLTAIQECIDQAPDIQIAAIGLSNQRESVISWDAQSGNPVGPAITWQCRRTSAETEALKQQGHEAIVLALTGLPLDPLFPASKIKWLMNLGGSEKRCIGTVDSWLIWNLTNRKVFATDHSNASRTQLLNVINGDWDNDLCELFGVDKTALPAVKSSNTKFGYTSKVPGLADGIPITSAIGDSHAALFGHAAFSPGEAKATFGTGSSVMMVSSEFVVPHNGMTTTIAWSIDDEITYALEGNILVSASLFPWISNLLGMTDDVDQLMDLAGTVDGPDGVMIVPALVGLGAPHWNPEVRGLISGLSFATTPAHIANASALSIPLQVVDVVAAMAKQTGEKPSRLFVDGGPTKNRMLMQWLADLLDQPICISKDPELSALGAGMLAGLQTGFWSSLEEIAQLERNRDTLNPLMKRQDRRNLLTQWTEAVAKCQHKN